MLSHDETYVLSKHYSYEPFAIYYIRLQRDGWKLKEELKTLRTLRTHIFEKPLLKGWILRKIAHVGSSSGRPVVASGVTVVLFVVLGE